MAASGSRIRAGIAASVVWTALAACAGAPPRPAIDGATRGLVEGAEHAEAARRYDRARPLYERAIRDAPDGASGAWAARQYASALLLWGDAEAAGRQLERVVELDPGDASAWHDLGVLRHRRGDVPGAERALRRAVELAPRDARPRVALAAVLVNAARLDDALAQYRLLLTLELPARTRDAIVRAIELLEAEPRP